MTASRRLLAVLAVLVVLLAVLAVLDRRRAPAVAEDRALVPGFDSDAVTALTWTRGATSARITHARARWQWQAPDEGDVDPAGLDRVLSTLRAARWHRTAPVAAAGRLGTRLAVSLRAGHEALELALGDALAGSAQGWIVVGDRALLVDAWVLAALDLDPLALHVRRPFPDPSRAAAIQVERPGVLYPVGVSEPGHEAAFVVRLEGSPRRLVQPRAMLVDAAQVEALERALAELAITHLVAKESPAATGGPDALVLRVGDGMATLEACPGDPALVRLRGAFGDGCVPAAEDRAVRAAVTALRGEPASVIERRPAPIDAARITLADGGVLDLSKKPTLDGHDADPASAAELVAALHAPALAVVVDPARAAARIDISGRDGGHIVLELLGHDHVRRAGEALALVLSPARYATLARAAAAYRDLQLWLEEPTTITSLVADGATYTRTPDGWVSSSGTPVEATHAARIEALVAVLAAPRALGPGPRAFATVHALAIEVTPPVGPPVGHVLEIGRPLPAGCPARANGESVLLPPAACRILGAP